MKINDNLLKDTPRRTSEPTTVTDNPTRLPLFTGTGGHSSGPSTANHGSRDSEPDK